MHRALQPKMKAMSDAILEGMVNGLGMPRDDLFQAFRLHDEGELVYSPTHAGAQRTDIIFIEIIAGSGYSDEVKQAGMSAIADELAKIGVKRDNVLLVTVDVFGSAWYSPKAE